MCRHTFQYQSQHWYTGVRTHGCTSCGVTVEVKPSAVKGVVTHQHFGLLTQLSKEEKALLAARPLTLRLAPEAKRSDTFKANKLDKVLDKAGKYAIQAVA